MTRHVLILGNNLTGLITAYRLLHYGFRIRIIDTQDPIQPTEQSRISLESHHATLLPPTPPITESRSLPLILHGFYHATWALFQELSLEWLPQTFQPVCLEFADEGRTPIALPKPSRLAWLHPLTRFTVFKGLSWSDRWHVINFLEKQWEENRLPNHNPDIENVEAWLISAKQSARSRSHFWNPLCRFFLNCDLSQASLGAFIEILSQYWLGQPTDAATFLTPHETLSKLKAALRQRLLNKGVQFHSSKTRVHIHTHLEDIQAMELDEKYFTAQVYISALRPHDLLSLLPERVLAHYANFSSLAHIPKINTLAIQWTVSNTLLEPRIILNTHPYDWITSQPSPNADAPKTLITCVALPESNAQELPDQWFIHTGWAFIDNLFNLSPAQTPESCELKFFRQAGLSFPCIRGARTHRPLPQTPLSNLFLAGPWTATNLPTSLESTIKSANACAEAVATSFYSKTH